MLLLGTCFTVIFIKSAKARRSCKKSPCFLFCYHENINLFPNMFHTSNNKYQWHCARISCSYIFMSSCFPIYLFSIFFSFGSGTRKKSTGGWEEDRCERYVSVKAVISSLFHIFFQRVFPAVIYWSIIWRIFLHPRSHIYFSLLQESGKKIHVIRTIASNSTGWQLIDLIRT